MRFKLEQGNEEINSTGGISIVGGILNKSNVFSGGLSVSGGGKLMFAGHCKAMIALQCEGRSDFNDIELHRKDPVFQESLELKYVPSESILRQRIGAAAEIGLVNDLPFENLKILCEADSFGTLEADGIKFTPVHCDVTPMDNSGTKKENVGRTYKGFDGYAPMMAYVGTEGYLLNSELRPGKQHCQKGTPEFLERTFALDEKLKIENPLYLLDSGNDSSDNLDLLLEAGKWFIIKRNPRKEPREWLVKHAKCLGDKDSPRAGKTVYTGSLSTVRPPKCKSVKTLFLHFEVTERTIDAKGEELLIPDYSINSWWSNIPNYSSTVVEFYHTQGTSEQFHSEYKSGLDLERLPAKKFSTNSLVFGLGMLAFNVLRLMGQSALRLEKDLPIKVGIKRRRVGSVIKDLIYIACKRIDHANRTILKFGRNCPWFNVFKKLSLKFC